MCVSLEGETTTKKNLAPVTVCKELLTDFSESLYI